MLAEIASLLTLKSHSRPQLPLTPRLPIDIRDTTLNDRHIQNPRSATLMPLGVSFSLRSPTAVGVERALKAVAGMPLAVILQGYRMRVGVVFRRPDGGDDCARQGSLRTGDSGLAGALVGDEQGVVVRV